MFVSNSPVDIPSTLSTAEGLYSELNAREQSAQSTPSLHQYCWIHWSLRSQLFICTTSTALRRLQTSRRRPRGRERERVLSNLLFLYLSGDLSKSQCIFMVNLLSIQCVQMMYLLSLRCLNMAFLSWWDFCSVKLNCDMFMASWHYNRSACL